MNMLFYATMYLDQGYSVIPLRLDNKKPALNSWLEYQTRRPTDEEVYRWFGGSAKRNIGIITGAVSGLCVVDLDSDKAL